MKRIILVIALIALSICTSFSQVETKFYPRQNATENMKFLIGMGLRKAEYSVKKEVPVSWNANQLLLEDQENTKQSGLFRFGKGINTSYTLEDGEWTPIDGGRFWTMTIEAKDARSISIVFDKLLLPNNAELYITNKDETELYGPVKSDMLPKIGDFITESIIGPTATIYLFEPSEEYGKTMLGIKRIIYGYRDVSSLAKLSLTRAISDCGVDVACYPEYEKESKGVVRIMMGSPNGINYYYGSGSLLMSTDYLYKPYLLTAFHCLDIINTDGILSTDEKAAVANWVFTFNYKRVECGGSSNASTYTYNGATFRAALSSSDFALIELNQNVRQNENICWLGWDRSNSTPSSAVGIHHPHGEEMEISLEYSSLPGIWAFNYDEGMTRGGSSGSPLLNQDKRVVGQLNSGVDESMPNPCNLPFALYYKIYNSWTGGGSSSTRLSDWLDPINTGQTTINSSYPFENFRIVGNRVLGSTNSYYVDNLPSSMSVTWSLSDSYFNQYCLQQNTPTTNQCSITHDNSHQMENATLTANLWNNGTLLKQIVKIVSSYPGFYGTYYNGSSTQQINLPSPLYALNGSFVDIYSPFFIEGSVSHSGVTPTIWSFDNSENGHLRVGMPSSGGKITVSLSCANGSQYTIRVFGTNNINPLSVSMDGSILEVSTMAEDCNLVINNAITGEKIYSKPIKASSYTINTDSWPKGVYIVSVFADEKVHSQKIVIGN